MNSETTSRLSLQIMDGIAVLTLDNAERPINLVDDAFLTELESAIGQLSTCGAKGLVILSAKAKVFLAGADLHSLGSLRGEALSAMITRGQQVFESIARLRLPTVAAIHGACLGGGLELALACRQRIASDSHSTKIGFPETQLGLLPAWGGSTRLPRLLGLPKALSLILSGKQLDAGGAKHVGLIDEIVPKERLLERAIALIQGRSSQRKTHFWTNNPLVAALIRQSSQRQLLAKTHGHYPALLTALDVVSRAGMSPQASTAASFERERNAFLELVEGDTTHQLIRLFFLQEDAKSRRYDEGVDIRSLPPTRSAAVIGAGVMGSGIAQFTAARGIPVLLADIDAARVAQGMKSVARLFDEAVRRHIFTPHEAERKRDLVAPTADPVSLRGCDLVIEAAVENLEVKKKIFADLCVRSSDRTVLATNTSALPITELAKSDGITHPERILGIHFFNPVSRMKLVEIVVTELTSPETVERALAFVRALGKTPVVVKDSPGFLVNRILMPYLVEAARLVESGVSVARIDQAMLDFGMPMGPLRLLDEIGLDVAGHVASTMTAAFGERFAIPALLDQLTSEGKIGRKSGSGFYDYDHRRETPRVFQCNQDQPGLDHIARQLADCMSHEAQLCLDEKIVADADSIDLAMVLGTGYAPFRGGPMKYQSILSERTAT